jgi:hypothetical protein
MASSENFAGMAAEYFRIDRAFNGHACGAAILANSADHD